MQLRTYGRECLRTRECDGVYVFAVVCHCHIFLAEPYGIFALGDTIKHLKILFGDALTYKRKIVKMSTVRSCDE